MNDGYQSEGGPRAVPLPIARSLTLGLVYFAAVFAAGFALGVVRTLVLEPLVGPVTAVALELPLMLGWAWWVCTALVRRNPRLAVGAALTMGTTALACLLLAEAALSVFVAGRSVAGHLALYRVPAHALGLGGQLLFAAWPLVQVLRRARLANEPV